MMNPMRILVRLVLNRKFLEIISRCCATLSTIGCSSLRLLHVEALHVETVLAFTSSTEEGWYVCIYMYLHIWQLLPYLHITHLLTKWLSAYHKCNMYITNSSTNQHRTKLTTPHQKLLGGGVSTPGPLFCLICTIISNKRGLLDSYQNTPEVPAARSFLVAGFDTRWDPRRGSAVCL